MTYFKIPTRYSLGETEEKHENHQMFQVHGLHEYTYTAPSETGRHPRRQAGKNLETGGSDLFEDTIKASTWSK
jgi:hypothetical protein